MTKINLKDYNINYDSFKERIEFQDKTTKKIVGFVSEQNQNFLKSREELTFWDKFCRWTLGLFGKKWDDVDIYVNNNINKTFCVFQKALPELEQLSHDVGRSPQQTQSGRTHFSKFATSEAASRPHPQAESLRSKRSRFAQQEAHAPKEPLSPKEDSASKINPYLGFSEKELTEASTFISLRNLILRTCKLPQDCKESDLLHRLKSKISQSNFQSGDTKFLIETLELKYKSFAIPVIECNISVLEDAIKSENPKNIRNLICNISKLPHDVDDDTLKSSIRDIEERIDAIDQSAAPFYYFKALLAARKDFPTQEKRPALIPLLGVTESEIKKAKSPQEKRDLLVKILSLKDDVSDADLKKTVFKKLREIHPDKVDQRGGTAEEKKQAQQAFQIFNALWEAVK